MGAMFEGITAAHSSIKTYGVQAYDVKNEGTGIVVNV